MALMSRRRKVLLSIAAVSVVVLLAVAWRVLPVFTGPALPAGATRLHIATERPNATPGCATALLMPARVTTSGDDLVLVTDETGETVPVVWPAGFAAWRVDGRAVVADPWGSVVGREGDVLDSLGGGFSLDDAFHVCPYGIVTEP
jgi:hypothetical protein